MLNRLIKSREYWRWKGWGRILLLSAIAVYGVGLLLKRIESERREALAIEVTHTHNDD